MMSPTTATSQEKTDSSLLFNVAKALVALGILLRLIQLLTNQGLGEAEGHLVINFATRDINGLLLPLDHGQVAPILFLLIEKINVNLFGLNEFALRYFVFLLSIVALVLFYQFLRKHTNAWVTVAGVLLMSVDRSIILLSSVAKQYSGDLMMAILLYYVLFLTTWSKRKRIIVLGVVGAAAIWFSHPVIFVLFSIGVYLLVEFFSTPSERFSIGLAYVLWGTSFAALYLITIAGHPSASLMTTYWNEHFMPLLPTTTANMAWFGTHFRDMIANMLGFSPKHYLLWIPYGISLIAGIIYLYRTKQYRYLLWTGLPIIVHLLASGFRLYPFNSRLIVYLSFPLMLFMAFGFYAIVKKVSTLVRSSGIQYVALIILAAVTFIVTLSNFPYPTEDIKKSLEVVRRNFRPGDKVFVYAPMDASYKFYGTRYVPAGTAVTYGRNSRDDYSDYDRQIASMTGRVWFVFSHLYTNANGVAEDDYIINSAKKRGEVLITGKSYLASVYLVDLKR